MKQFNGIEVCRFVCALSVIIWHYQHFFFLGSVDASVTNQLRPNFPFFHFLKPFYFEGGFAVQIFWTISGFIFFWKYSSLIFERSVSARDFFILRFSRLYPLHFVTLLVVVVLQLIYHNFHKLTFIYQHNNFHHFVLQIFFVSNWLGREPFTFNGPIWSVSVEVLAYLVFFVALRAFSPSILLCFAMCLIIKILFHFHPDPALSCLSFFFAGGFVERCINRLHHRGRVVSVSTATAGIFLVIGGLYLGMQFSMKVQLLLSVFVVWWFALIEEIIPIRLSSIAWVGNMTYSSYLIHFPIQLLTVIIADSLGVTRTFFFSPVAFVVFILFTFFVAFIVYEYFERPAQNALRNKFIQSRQKKFLDPGAELKQA